MFFSFVFLNEQIEIIGKLLWYNRNKRRLGLLENNHIFSCFVFLKLKFMWGNLAVGSGERWREVSVPTLQPGQVCIWKKIRFLHRFLTVSSSCPLWVVHLGSKSTSLIKKVRKIRMMEWKMYRRRRIAVS